MEVIDWIDQILKTIVFKFVQFVFSWMLPQWWKKCPCSDCNDPLILIDFLNLI